MQKRLEPSLSGSVTVWAARSIISKSVNSSAITLRVSAAAVYLVVGAARYRITSRSGIFTGSGNTALDEVKKTYKSIYMLPKSFSKEMKAEQCFPTPVYNSMSSLHFLEVLRRRFLDGLVLGLVSFSPDLAFTINY